MVEEWGAAIREHLSPRRVDRVQLDTLRAQRSVKRANDAIKQIENETVLQRRVRLMARRVAELDDEQRNPL